LTLVLTVFAIFKVWTSSCGPGVWQRPSNRRNSKRFIIACARNPFIANAFAPINALTRRFYFVYQRETKDVARASALHAAVLKAIASGDEVAAAEAATAMVDYAEYYTRSVIVGRTTIDPWGAARLSFPFHSHHSTK
jgi:hypothetical protein